MGTGRMESLKTNLYQVLGMIGILQNMVVYALKAIFGHTETKVEEQKASSYNLRERKPVNYKEVEEDE
jgi:hypothetical protein